MTAKDICGIIIAGGAMLALLIVVTCFMIIFIKDSN